MMDSGIYEIKHKTSGNRYVGSSTQLKKRLVAHRNMLSKGNHHSIALQRSWNKYGVDRFEFNILAFLEKSELASTEQRLLDKCFVEEKDLYNIARGAYAPMRGRKHTKERNQKHADRMIGNKYGVGHAPWSIENPPPSLGKLIAASKSKSAEWVAKIALAKTGVKQSEEHIEKRTVQLRGRKMSESALAKAIGKKMPKGNSEKGWITRRENAKRKVGT